MYRNVTKVFFVLLGFSLLLALPQGAAAFDKATVQMQGVGTFPIVAFSQGVSNSSLAAATGGGAGKVNFQPAFFAKEMDLNTPTLFAYAATGKHISEVTIEFFRYQEDLPVLQKYFTIKLSEVIVTSVRFDEEKGKPGGESISLDFSIIRWILPDGTEQGWNVKQNKAL